MAESRGTPWKQLAINIAGQPRLLRFGPPAQKLQSSPESAHTSLDPLEHNPVTAEQPLDPTTPKSVLAQPLRPRLLRFSDSSGPSKVDISNSSDLVCSSSSSSNTKSEDGIDSTTGTKMDTPYHSHMQHPQQRVHYEQRERAPLRFLNKANASEVGKALLRLGLQTGSTKPLRMRSAARAVEARKVLYRPFAGSQPADTRVLNRPLMTTGGHSYQSTYPAEPAAIQPPAKVVYVYTEEKAQQWAEQGAQSRTFDGPRHHGGATAQQHDHARNQHNTPSSNHQGAWQQHQQHRSPQGDASSQGPHGTPASRSAAAHSVGNPETNNISRLQQPQASTPSRHASDGHAPQTQTAAQSKASTTHAGPSQTMQQTQTESVHPQIQLAEQNSPHAMQSRPCDASDAGSKARWHARDRRSPQTQPAAQSKSSTTHAGPIQATQQTQTESVHPQIQLAARNSPSAMQSRPWDASDAGSKARWNVADGPKVDRWSEQRPGTKMSGWPGSEDEQSLYNVDGSEQGDKAMSSSNERIARSAGRSEADADLETLHLNVHGQVSEEVQAEPSNPRTRSTGPAFASMAAQTENIVEDLLLPEVRFAHRPGLGSSQHTQKSRPWSARTAATQTQPINPPPRLQSAGPRRRPRQADVAVQTWLPPAPLHAALQAVNTLPRRKDWDSSPPERLPIKKGSELGFYKPAARRNAVLSALSKRIHPSHGHIGQQTPRWWSPRAPKQHTAGHNSRPPRLPQPMSFTDVTDCSRCQKFVRDVASSTGEPPLVKCGALEIGLVRSSARIIEEARHGTHSARPMPNSSMLLEADLQRCLKAAELLLARQGAQRSPQQSNLLFSTRRISAARRRKFQAELRDIRDGLSTVKKLTEGL